MTRNALAVLFISAAMGIAVAAQQAQQSPEAMCRITGTTRGAGVALPGVAISALAGDTVRGVSATQADGTYRLQLPPGAYRLRAELTGFDRAERDLVVTSPPSCDQSVDLALTLTPRRTAAASTPGAARAAGTGTRGGGAGAREGAAGARFQRLDVQQEAATDTDAPLPELTQDASLLPAGFGSDASGDAIAVNGAAARVDNGLLNDRNNALARGDFQIPPGLQGGAGGFGGFGQGGGDNAGNPGNPGAGGGGFQGGGRAGGFAGGRGQGGRGGGPQGGGRGGRGAIGGRGFQQPRVTVTADYTFGGSALDASPYQLRPDSPVSEKPYTQQSFGTTVGGRLKIPGLLSPDRTQFTLTYNGGRGATLFDQYGTVPTADLRAGNFAALGAPLIDPTTGQPFADNLIPASRISPQAQALLPFLPLPNLPGTDRNYHYTTSTRSNNDSINARVSHVFGAAANGRGGGGRGGGARGGGRGGRGSGVSLNVQLQYRRTDADQTNLFSTLGGTRKQTTIGVPVSVNITRARNFHQFNINFNHTSSDTTNRFAGVTNVAAGAGILGTASTPFAWGVPTLSFSSITGLRDLTPTDRSDRRISTTYSWTHPIRRHQLRFGTDVQFDRTSSDTEANANGTFIFTGIYSSASLQPIRGSDFADFLLGLPQQATVQYGPGTVTLKGRSLALYTNDDWRVNGRITLQLGVRYELLWPFVENAGHLVNLDVTPSFTAAAPVEADGTGPFTGAFPAALLKTDTNNVAPRIGIAWRIGRGTVVRGGYGTSYNNGTYSAIARQLASQPPFASTNTNIGGLQSALLLENALAGVTPNETTNTYGVDKDYALGRVETYNVDLTRPLGTVWVTGANYTYTRGSSLDVIRAPNRGPSGLRIEGVEPFLWEASEGESRLHSATFRLQRRQVKGLGGGIDYTLARSRDNAPSIGGGAGGGNSAIVAQNDQDLAAEWALSSFDRRQRVNANVNYDLPWGPNRPWLNNGGKLAALFEGWRATATLTLDSGTPLTARVQNASRDVSQGVTGALRADYDGAPIQISNPTINQFFNTGAFSVPAAGAFGTSARNVIIGPGSKQLNAQFSRDVRLGGTRALTIQMRVNNLLNNVNFAAVDTNVNSPTFGEVLSVRSMRSAQLNLRFRF